MNALRIPKDDVDRQILGGVLRRVWRMSGFGIMGFVYTWLLSLWVLQIFIHPGFFMGFGILYAFVLGLWLGSATQMEGGEEMLFSLPPTRAQRYWVQAAVGGLPLLTLCFLGVWALRVEAPQFLWGLFVTSGFTEPFSVKDGTPLWPWSVALPLLLFAGVYGFSAQAVNRGGIFLALILSGVFTAGIALSGWALESLLWEHPRGELSAALMLASTALALWGCGHRYQQKEGHPGPATSNTGVAGKVALIMGVAVILFLILSFLMLGNRSTQAQFHAENELRSSLEEFETRLIPPQGE